MDFSNADAADSLELIEYLNFGSRFSTGDKSRTYALQQLAPGMNVLDVGCGTGDDVRAIAAIVGAHGRVAGIDPNRAMITEAIRRGVPPSAQFELARADALPYADASFDAVRADRVFQHLHEPDAAASELRRVTKAGGTALLLDQDWGSLIIAGADPAMTLRLIRFFGEHLARPCAGREAPGFLRRAGFERVDFQATAAAPVFPVALVNILTPLVDAALRSGEIDAAGAEHWLASLLEADQRSEFLCAVLVIIALGRVAP